MKNDGGSAQIPGVGGEPTSNGWECMCTLRTRCCGELWGSCKQLDYFSRGAGRTRSNRVAPVIKPQNTPKTTPKHQEKNIVKPSVGVVPNQNKRVMSVPSNHAYYTYRTVVQSVLISSLRYVMYWNCKPIVPIIVKKHASERRRPSRAVDLPPVMKSMPAVFMQTQTQTQP